MFQMSPAQRLQLFLLDTLKKNLISHQHPFLIKHFQVNMPRFLYYIIYCLFLWKWFWSKEHIKLNLCGKGCLVATLLMLLSGYFVILANLFDGKLRHHLNVDRRTRQNLCS